MKCHHRGDEMLSLASVTQGFSGRTTNKHSSVSWDRQNISGVCIKCTYFGFLFFLNCNLDTWYRVRLSRQDSVCFPSTLPLISTYAHAAHLVELLALKPILEMSDLCRNFWSGTGNGSLGRGCGQETHHPF